MDNNSFTNAYYEAKIFNELKDVGFSGVNDMKKRYPDLNVDYYKIYRKIINYRIKKYGSSFMENPTFDNVMSREEGLKRSKSARRRKRNRLRGA